MNLLALLVVSYSLTLGADSGAFLAYQVDPLTQQPVHALYSDLQADVSLGPVYAGGGVRTDMTPLSLTDWDPLQLTFSARAGLRFTLAPGLEAEIGWQHDCYHPMNTYSTAQLLNGQTLAIPRFEGSVDDFHLTIKSRVGGK